tara:strand:- start:421 stop:633 length:213 start_codon:yes stop_codon:yes gene_type:complete
MKWTAPVIIIFLMSGCAWVEPQVIHPRDIMATTPPNSFLEPFVCGHRSIDVTHTIRTCAKGCETPPVKTK